MNRYAFLLYPLGFIALCCVPTLVNAGGPNRFQSPSGHYDILFEPLADDWTHAHKAQASIAAASMEQYAIAFSLAGSSAPVNVAYFSDAGTPLAPSTIMESMIWSPQEAFVVFKDRPRAALEGHNLQRVVGLQTRKIWDLEAGHVHWIDDHRLAGDLNTKEVPGGIVLFDGHSGTAELLIPPDRGIGYKVDDVSGHQVIVKELINHLDTSKTTWDHFDPACFSLDVDTLKKNSIPCPKAS